MKKSILLACLFSVYGVQANLLLEAPQQLTPNQVDAIAKQWHTTFSWCCRFPLKITAACSFIYEHELAGFALKIGPIPFYFHNYRLLPTADEIKRLFSSRPDYYFTQPLGDQHGHPTAMTSDELGAYIRSKKCVFYTGAGISASAQVPTMGALEHSLAMDQGLKHFLKVAWAQPAVLAQAFASFCHAAIYGKPTKAHEALAVIATQKAVAIVTENVDLLQQRAGVVPLNAHDESLRKLSEQDWQEIDAIVCIGLSRDDCGLLAWYKQQNPAGVLIAINMQSPSYLSDTDFVVFGDVQDVVPKITQKIRAVA